MSTDAVSGTRPRSRLERRVVAAAQRIYIHQLPQTAPRVAGPIEGVFGPAARGAQMVATVSRGFRWRETGASNPA